MWGVVWWVFLRGARVGQGGSRDTRSSLLTTLQHRWARTGTGSRYMDSCFSYFRGVNQTKHNLYRWIVLEFHDFSNFTVFQALYDSLELPACVLDEIGRTLGLTSSSQQYKCDSEYRYFSEQCSDGKQRHFPRVVVMASIQLQKNWSLLLDFKIK